MSKHLLLTVLLAFASLPAYCREDAGWRWWTLFGDATLDSLVTIAEENNSDVATAATRIDIARAGVAEARAAYWPQLQLGAGYTCARHSGAEEGHGVPAVKSHYASGTVSLSWEVDVFGKITRRVRQARTQVSVTAAEYEGVMLSLKAEVATAYFTLLQYRMQLKVADTHSASQEHILHMTEARYNAGLASKLDVAQAGTLYWSTRASVPLLEASIEAQVNALSVLLGVPRDQLPQAVMEADSLPELRVSYDAGVQADLVCRRPDVVAADRAVTAAAQAVGIARDAWLPSLTVEASAGTSARRMGDLFTKDSFSYAVAPTLSWTVFDGFARRAQSQQARDQLELQVNNYNNTVLTAYEEVRNAVSRYQATLQYIDMVGKVVENAAESVRLSVDLYRGGLTAFTNVDDAELNYLTYENTLVSARAQAFTAIVDVFKATGGGFSADDCKRHDNMGY